MERIFAITLNVCRSIGYIGLGCTIVGFFEVGVFPEMIFGFVISLMTIIVSYDEPRRRKKSEIWTGKQFIAAVLGRPIKKEEVDEFEEMIVRLSDEVWDLCATEEDKERIRRSE